MPRSRRRFRKPARGGARVASRQAALRALRRAHRLQETGQHAQAYPVLKQLADGAAQRGRPVQAAHLYLQAARARLEMAAPGTDNAAWDGVALAQRAAQLLAGAGEVARIEALLSRLVQALEAGGYHKQAVALRAEGRALMGASALRTFAAQTSAERQGTLPVRCPACNGPLCAKEAFWVDARSADCAYCGSNVRAE